MIGNNSPPFKMTPDEHIPNLFWAEYEEYARFNREAINL
jgi:hypothetical protein